MSAAQRETAEAKKHHEELRVLYNHLLASDASSRAKLEGLLTQEELWMLRTKAAEADFIPALRSQIEDLLSSNAALRSRAEILEDERTEVARLRGAEIQVLTLTETASDMQKQINELTSQLAYERDGRVKSEALRETLHARLVVLELETKSEIKEMEDKYVLFATLSTDWVS